MPAAIIALGARPASGRTEALRAGDEQTFLKPFTGRARDAQRRTFRNLTKLRFVRAAYTLVASTQVDARTTQATVAFVHQIKNVDLLPVAETYVWTVKRGPRGLTVTKVAGADEPGSYHPMPWDLYRDMTVITRRNVLVIAPKRARALAKKAAGTLADAAADDLAVWKRNGPPGSSPRPAS